MGHEEHLMPKDDDIARRELRELLIGVRELLEGPPLSVKFRLAMEAMLDMLGEQDLGKRLAMREQISAYLAETWGE
jgi:hypothetical protein